MALSQGMLDSIREAINRAVEQGSIVGVVVEKENGELAIQLFKRIVSFPREEIPKVELSFSPTPRQEDRREPAIFVILSFPQTSGSPSVVCPVGPLEGVEGVEWPGEWPIHGRVGAMATVVEGTLVCYQLACIACSGTGLHPLARCDSDPVQLQTAAVCPVCGGAGVPPTSSR